jgi:hypothetical protein
MTAPEGEDENYSQYPLARMRGAVATVARANGFFAKTIPIILLQLFKKGWQYWQ